MKHMFARYGETSEALMSNKDVEVETNELFSELQKLYYSLNDESVRINEIYDKLRMLK